MRPSEIREQILAEHRRALSLLDAARECAQRVRGGLGDSLELRRRLRLLEEALSELFDDEEEILQPHLAEVDAWGDVRVAQLGQRHRAQRDLLARAVSEAEEGRLAPRDLAAAVLDTLGDLREELRQKERHFLHPELLRDDLVVVAQSDG